MSHLLVQENEQLRRERDLYLRLLELGTSKELGVLLEEALALIVEVTGTQKGYLALYSEGDEELPRFFIARGFLESEIKEIQRKISRGIISQAMAAGQVINTPAALEDSRFQENQSVQRNEIHAVLCAPVSLGEEPLGVLYLQEREEQGSFSKEDIKRATLFARHLAPLVDRLLSREQAKQAADATALFRLRLTLTGLVGKSQALADVFRQVESAARFDISVLLTGPSGTGKTALARAIHDNSPREKKPFLELNCAALPETLFESELFGALPGAHSTATRKTPGKLAAAEGGTLFLDEVGELSLGVQSKLLQFLQSKEYFLLGGNRPEKADVRILAATNADIEETIARKTFREDLYYRLNVLPIRVPSLSERKEDIPLLVERFCRDACEKYGLPSLSLSPAAMRAVEVADWPGNIRQLANAVQAAVIRAAAEERTLIEVQHLFPESVSGPLSEGKRRSFQDATRHFQKRLLLEVLEEARWKISEAARILGLTRVHVYNLIRAFALRHDEPGG